MSGFEHLRGKHAPAADTPVRRALRFVLQPAALGLLLGLLVAALLGNWFRGQAEQQLVDEQQARIAIVEASALAEFVATTLAANPDETAALQSGIIDWAARSPGDDNIRVVRLGGARLLASTYPAESGGELPDSARKRSGCSISGRNCARRQRPIAPKACSASRRST